MSISANVLAIGSPQSLVHPPSVHDQRITLTNMQPISDADEYARDGYVFIVNAIFTLGNNASTAFAMRTGPHGAQFQFYEIDVEDNTVRADLIQGATYGTGGTVTGYNLNRNFSDSYDAVLTGATNITGGTIINTEYIPASRISGSILATQKIVTLEPSTEYVMRFTNLGAPSTQMHFQLGWSEQYNGGHDIWVNQGTASVDNGLRLKPQQTITLEISPLDNLVAYSSQPTRLSVMRQVVD